MDRRTHESPMDFEWQTGRGPVDVHSPFAQVGSPFQQDTPGKKRPFSIFGSPQKPATPSLRPPASQPHYFNQPPSFSAHSHFQPPTPNQHEVDKENKPLPSIPSFNNPAFTTPRKLDLDFSEGATSPEATPGGLTSADNTPDTSKARDEGRESMGFGKALAKTFSFGTGSRGLAKERESDKERKSRMERRNAASPRRGDVQRGNYSMALDKRIQRRRKREAEQRGAARRGAQVESESENEVDTKKPSSDPGASHKSPPQRDSGPSKVGAVFSFIEAHPNLPHILSFYAQLLLNVFLVFAFIYILYCGWSNISADVDEAAAVAQAEVMTEIAACVKQYRENRCDGEQRVPAMENACNNWYNCMQRDPKAVGRARVSAHTFAQIFNSFIEPISYKAMFFTVFLIVSCILISNFAFNLFRTRSMASNPHLHPQMPYASMQSVPATPQRHPSAGWDQHAMGWPSQGMLGFNPASNQAFGMSAGESSPVRQIQYR